MPLVRVPTAWPRFCGVASIATQATSTCTTTAIRPTISMAPSSVAILGDNPAATNAATESNS